MYALHYCKNFKTYLCVHSFFFFCFLSLSSCVFYHPLSLFISCSYSFILSNSTSCFSCSCLVVHILLLLFYYLLLSCIILHLAIPSKYLHENVSCWSDVSIQQDTYDTRLASSIEAPMSLYDTTQTLTQIWLRNTRMQ
jgi:hypothetical protein